jgi:hypothetical protein
VNRKHGHGLTLSAVTFWLFAEALFAFLLQIKRKLDNVMALVSIEQTELDSIASEVSDVADSLQAVLDSETPLDPADETALKAAVEKLSGVGVKAAPGE